MEKSFYTLNWFNTKDRRIQSLARPSENEIYSEMLRFISRIPHDKSNEVIDYDWDTTSLKSNEHNAFVKEDNGTKWYFTTICYKY